MPEIPPYATWDADRLNREGISPVLALEARIASAETAQWKLYQLRDARCAFECQLRIDSYRDALAIITAPSRRSDVNTVANQ